MATLRTAIHLLLTYLLTDDGVQVGGESAALQPLVDLMPSVKYAGDRTDIVAGFDPATLLPRAYLVLAVYTSVIATMSPSSSLFSRP